MNEGRRTTDDDEVERATMRSEHSGTGEPTERAWYGTGSAPQDPPSSPAPRSIAVCIDDYGLHAGINRAALELAGAHRVSAISCMPDGPAWAEGVAELHALPAGVQLGLHVNLTEPIGPAGLTRPLSRLILRAYLAGLDPTALRHEIRRQLGRFEDGVGRPPDFLDGHQHVHQLPGVREALIDILNEHTPSIRPWLRRTRPAQLPPGSAVTRAARAKAWLIDRLGGAALGRLAAGGGYPQNGRLLGVYAFDGTEYDYLERLHAWFEAAADGDVLMCHPSVEGPWRDPILPARTREYRVLSSPQFAELAVRCGIAIGPLARLPPTGRAGSGSSRRATAATAGRGH